MAASNKNGTNNRDSIIIRTSIIGIIANILLAAFKAAVGLLSNSIAITLDAVNNLSDALSSVITIVGTHLSGRRPDKKHPYGYGRIEYLSATIISVIVLYAGITSLEESIRKIIHPEVPNYTTVSIVIVAVAVAVKIVLGLYVKTTGQKVNSDSLINSGADALLDSIISASTLVASIIYLCAGVSLEAWLGAIISIVIIRSGIEMLRETISRILGERSDSSIAKNIKKDLCTIDGVLGAYDLILHDYGPDRIIGSVHLEVPDYFTADEIDKIGRKAFDLIRQNHGIFLSAVGTYSHNTGENEISLLREEIRKRMTSHEYVLQMHGFYIDTENKLLRFDVVVDYAVPDEEALQQTLIQEVNELCPDYQVAIAFDSDMSD